jgi:hypothetical protein
VQTVEVEELCAGKLCALLARVLPRDCYDVIRLPAIAGGRRDRRLRHLFIALAGALDRPLPDYGRQRLEKITQAAVAEQLHPMLSSDDRPSAVELKRETWKIVAPLLKLTKVEREYSERLQIGELRPELLFPDDEKQADLLRNHPVLLWKVHNAKVREVRPTRKRSPAPRGRR